MNRILPQDPPQHKQEKAEKQEAVIQGPGNGCGDMTLRKIKRIGDK